VISDIASEFLLQTTLYMFIFEMLDVFAKLESHTYVNYLTKRRMKNILMICVLITTISVFALSLPLYVDRYIFAKTFNDITTFPTISFIILRSVQFALDLLMASLFAYLFWNFLKLK